MAQDSIEENDLPTLDNLDLVGDPSKILQHIRKLLEISQADLSQYLGSSIVSIARWERGESAPNSETLGKILRLHKEALEGRRPELSQAVTKHTFASRGARTAAKNLPLFERARESTLALSEDRQPPLLKRLKPSLFWGNGASLLAELLAEHPFASPTLTVPSQGGVSAGKNTYTYDAHTYHTKVPPQGIAEILKQYLPEGGVVLDPFSGSGMTGVAARTLGHDVILNELSPAASFISDRFTRHIDPIAFSDGVKAICDATKDVRSELYDTDCRECGKTVEIQYTVWSYRVKCSECSEEFVLWDHCRKYGKTVREHKILSEFPCPCCNRIIKKSRLARTYSVPVLIGYKCCRRVQVEHSLSEADLAKVARIERLPPVAAGDFPTLPLPDGVNLRQPKRHGLTSVDRLYTPRNLAAMSHLWRATHYISDPELAGFLGFVFTSLYQRVTRMSEYRFWGGSGNTANFNVPYIFNEANVFTTFARKARTIQDHLETTARHYRGRCVVHTGSATRLGFLPDASVDLVFTDPPFGANINYSEMNILWESWLGEFTDNRHEAIVNKHQGKDTAAYGDLMQQSLTECYRVLRPGHWLLLVFMNSSREIWEQLQKAISHAGFSLERMDIFDKQHGTFKQFVSENTAGADLILHCRKGGDSASRASRQLVSNSEAIADFLTRRNGPLPTLPFLHVNREPELDYRTLYAEWLATGLLGGGSICDFAVFRGLVASYLHRSI